MAVTGLSPSARLTPGTSPQGGGGSDAPFLFPPQRGKWLSVSETEGGAPRTLSHARSLRKHLTRAETILWSRLRRGQMMGLRIRRQHPIGPYIADFACRPLKLVIEVDGATHTDAAYDARRTAFMERQGWTVMRVFNVDVYESLDGVMDAIHTRLSTLKRARTASLEGEKTRFVSIRMNPRSGKDMK